MHPWKAGVLAYENRCRETQGIRLLSWLLVPVTRSDHPVQPVTLGRRLMPETLDATEGDLLMRRLTAVVLLLGLLLPASGCQVTGRRPSEGGGAKRSPTIARWAALSFSDALVADLVAGREDRVYRLMEQRFRHTTSKEEFSAALVRMYADGGKPLEAEFKSDKVGYKIYPGGERKPMRKFYYALRTTEHDKGSYFLTVEVVPEEGRLACTFFVIVSFADDVPKELR